MTVDGGFSTCCVPEFPVCDGVRSLGLRLGSRAPSPPEARG